MIWRPSSSNAGNAGPSTRSRRATCARSASDRSRSATTTQRSTTSARSAGASRAARRTSGATTTSCRSRARSRRRAPGLPAGCTPLIRADRLAERLGLRRGLGQERRHEPDALLQGSRRVGRRDARPRARLRHARLCVDRQPRELGRGPRRRARDGVVRADPGRPRGAEGARDRRLRHEPRQGPRQLRRRQPPLHGAVGRPRELGLREHQHAPVLRRGLEDRRLRDRRAARLGAARPLRRADRVGLAVHEDRARAFRSSSTSACSTARCRR